MTNVEWSQATGGQNENRRRTCECVAVIADCLVENSASACNDKPSEWTTVIILTKVGSGKDGLGCHVPHKASRIPGRKVPSCVKSGNCVCVVDELQGAEEKEGEGGWRRGAPALPSSKGHGGGVGGCRACRGTWGNQNL